MQRRRSRIVIIAALVQALVTFIALPLEAGLDRHGATDILSPHAWVQFTLVVLLLAVTMLVRLRPHPAVAELLPLVTLVGVAFLASFDGGFTSPVLLWAPALPLLAAFVAGPRQAVVTGILMIGMLIGFYAHAFITGLMAGLPVGEASQHWLRLVALGDVTLFMSVFAWIYEDARRHHVGVIRRFLRRVQRKNTELTESELRFRQTAEGLASVVTLRDAQTDELLYINGAYETIWGRSREDLYADPESWLRGVHDDDRARVQVGYHGRTVEYRVLRPDGVTRWVRTTVRKIGSKPPRLVGITTDITDEKTAQALRNRFFEANLEAQEAERRHISRELHDSTGQALTAMLVALRALEASITEPAAAREEARRIREYLREVMQELGRLCRGLRPASLDELGLLPAMARLVQEFESQGLVIDFQQTGEWNNRLPSPYESALYRVTQEILTNVVKHAEAEVVMMQLDLEEDRVRLSVRDDGRGFSTSAPRDEQGGLGLVGIGERTALLGGKFDVWSRPGVGTRITVELPIHRTSTDAQLRLGVVA